MPLNSVNTNAGAMVALQSLNRTNDALDVTQKRISTGFRVSDAKDDGAAFAVAQSVRADVAGLTSANEQLGGTQGILETTLKGLEKVSTTMVTAREVLTKLSDSNLSATQRMQYEEQFNSLQKQVTDFLSDATYNGKKLVGDTAAGATADAATDMSVVRNEAGSTVTIAATSSSTLTFTGIASADKTTAADTATDLNAAAAAAQTALTGNFATVFAAVNTAMNNYGNDSKYVSSQIEYNKQKLDSMESGLGALIDADLAKESARLQALQIRQQLGTQSLGIANQAPQSLLSLFQN